MPTTRPQRVKKNLADIGVGHHALATFFPIADRFSLFGGKLAVLGIGYEPRLASVLFLDDDRLDQTSSVSERAQDLPWLSRYS